MRYCGHIGKLCPRMIFSEAVTFTAPNLIIDLPAGTYNNGQKYCVVIADTIPADTTRDAPVVFTIGGGTVLYPLVSCSGAQVTERALNTRTRYAVRVSTTATGGSFRLLGKTCGARDNNVLTSIDGTDTTTAGGGTE